VSIESRSEEKANKVSEDERKMERAAMRQEMWWWDFYS
jgi:hypothetical protein